MSLRSFLGAARRQALCTVFRQPSALASDFPATVTFTFDDFPRTAYLVAGPILESVGARGTYYAALGLSGTTDQLGEQLLRKDVISLVQTGHELGSQTYNHLSSRQVPHTTYCHDVQRGLEAIQRLTGQQCSNFAYPYGHLTLRTKKHLSKGLTSCRSVVPGLNGPEVDLAMLRANKLYGDVDKLLKAQSLIRATLERKSWLIFYTHDVRPNPSQYGCTPALFEAVVSFAAQSGCRIRTVQQVLTEMGVQPAEASALAVP